MVDFSALLRKPAGEAKKPPALPQGAYPAIIKSFELGDNNKNKTPYVRFNVGYTGWAEDVEPIEGLDLSSRGGRRDFYLTEEALWRFDEFLKSLGIAMEGKSYEEVLPETIGQHVIADVVQQLNQQTNEIQSFVNDIRAAA